MYNGIPNPYATTIINPYMKMPCHQGNVMCQNSYGTVVEPTQNSYIQKDYFVNVQHVQPIHTHTLNKVHYNHNYVPEYINTESTEVINNECTSCGNYIYK